MKMYFAYDNIITENFYIFSSYMDKVIVYVVKNFMKLLKIKVLVIFGVWGGKG